MPRSTGPGASGRRGSRALDRLDNAELAEVLRALLARHRPLGEEAEAIAREMVASPDEEHVAEAVAWAISSVDTDAVNERAGEHPWGYVYPNDAAWDLLEEAIKESLADMTRRAELGLAEAAATICRGIVTGLFRAQNSGGGGAIEWAPDFPAEVACNALNELLRTYPRAQRQARGERLLAELGAQVPKWHDALRRTAENAARRK